MTYIHESPNFPDLLGLVRDGLADRGIDLAPSLVEKDYWITHVLWALQGAGLEVSFKGGTSLSKSFGIIQRFSEDLDLRIGPGNATLPSAGNWKSDRKTAVASRKAFFKALADLRLPSVRLELDKESLGDTARGAVILVDYPGMFKDGLPASASPSIKLEVGEARVRPSIKRPISSWVHDHIGTAGLQGRFDANHVVALDSVHPIVTLVEKLDAISRRFIRPDLDARTFARHYEDAAHIVRALPDLPLMDGVNGVDELILEMRRLNQIRELPNLRNEGFNPDGSERWAEIARVHSGIQPLFWGPRIPLADACGEIRKFLGGLGPVLGVGAISRGLSGAGGSSAKAP